MHYIKDPKLIESNSMEIIAGLVPQVKAMDPQLAKVAKRIIHTTGDPDIFPLIRWSEQAVAAGLAAIRQGGHVVTDVNMLKAGISAKTLKRFGGEVHCFIGEPSAAQLASEKSITRAMAAMELALPYLDGGIIAIGNAPTALFYLLELIETGKCRPALIIGTPVGFVGAKESKELLLQKPPVDYFSIEGNRGGSTIAASIVNALLYMA